MITASTSPLKRSLRFLPVLFLLLLLGSCQKQEMRVYLEIKLPDRVDLHQYKTLLFGGFAVNGLPEGFDIEHLENDFFLGDLARQYNLKAVRTPTTISEPEKPDPVKLQALSADHETPVLITGKIDIDNKSHSMVRERRVASIGKRIRSIVKLNQMILKIDLCLYNPQNGQLLWKRSYTQQENEYPSEKESFTLRSLFYKITDRFSRDIGLQERRVRRTLLEE